MTTKRDLIFASFFFLLAFLQVIPTSAEVYKYIDNNGITHYTDNLTTIPPEYQSQLRQSIEQVPPITEGETITAFEERLSSGHTIQEPATGGPKKEVPEPDSPAIALSSSGVSDAMEESSESKRSCDASENRHNAETKNPMAEVMKAKNVSDSDPAPLHENHPSELSAEASPDPEATEPRAEQVSAISGSKAKTEQIRQLGEQRNALEEKIKQLDQQYRSVLEERKRLADQRRHLNSKSEIESYNQQVQQLNDKIQEYRNQRQTLEFEVRVFNDSIAR